ncbi:MAG: hypothetical protein M1334_01085 [Patescibacteria group bacterium]|nr:hypothetical protein [Patescibacteria group bacterium]
MDNQNQNYMPGQNQMAGQPQGNGVPPVPPSPSVKVRTMESDYKSTTESGGQPPVPEKVVVPPVDPNVKFSNFNTPPKEPTFQPSVKPSSVQPSVAPTNIAKKKSPVILIIIFLVIIALGIGGYFGYSYFFAQPSAPTAPVSTPLSTPTQPSIPAPAAVPTTTPAAPSLIHQSFFKTPAQTVSLSFDPTAGLLGYKTALATVIPSNATSGLYEVLVKDNSGNALGASTILPILTSSISSSSLGNYFQPDITVFLYKDNGGIWPGYILTLNSSVSLSTSTSATSSMAAIKASVANLESASDLPNFYLANPGTFGAFKDGKLGTQATRYSVSTNKDAFNYGFFGNYLVLSDSYNGLKAAVTNLGF